MAITRTQQARQMLKDGNFAVQGGGPNYLGKQREVKVPVKWQSGPDKPATELAYITEAEKDLLLKKDIHGSLKDGPNKGPGYNGNRNCNTKTRTICRKARRKLSRTSIRTTKCTCCNNWS